jgi:low affinity Fe/Cu permease
MAALTVMVWLISGPYYNYSDTWQLVINTGTTIVTFLMVFLIQNSQNRDNAAIQVKLDELIRASAAQNFYIGIEHLSDEEIDQIREKCEMRGRAAQVADETTQQISRKAARAADEATGL